MKDETHPIAEETQALLRSKDGALISCQKSGSGRPLLLVAVGLDDSTENVPLEKTLSSVFIVYNYARRGRGASGHTVPYAVPRKVEDSQALMDLAGDGVGVFGISYGRALAFIAAPNGLPIAKLAVFEAADSISSLLPHAANDSRPLTAHPRSRKNHQYIGQFLHGIGLKGAEPLRETNK